MKDVVSVCPSICLSVCLSLFRPPSLVWRQVLTMAQSALDGWLSSLSLLNAGVINVHHHIGPETFF